MNHLNELNNRALGSSTNEFNSVKVFINFAELIASVSSSLSSSLRRDQFIFIHSNERGIKLMNIILTGSVAVGKSNLMRRLKEEIDKLFVFPEFIDENLILSTEDEKQLSLEMLRKRFSGEITPYELQDYILQRWDDYAQRGKRIDRSRPRLFERLPDDSVEVFALPIISADEFTQLKLHLIRTNRTLPSYHLMRGCRTIWIDYENSFNEEKEREIVKIVKKALTDGLENCIINIRSPGNRNYDNYLHRGRTEEHYSSDEMKILNARYSAYTEGLIDEIKPLERYTL